MLPTSVPSDNPSFAPSPQPTRAFDLIIPISTSGDDIEEFNATCWGRSAGYIYVTSTDLEFAVNLGDCESPMEQIVGLRFNNIAAAQNSIVDEAVIEFTVDTADLGVPNTGGSVTLSIQAENSNNAAAYDGNTLFAISSRTYYSTQVLWQPEVWTASSPFVRTVDISPIVQQVFNRPDWVSGNSMAFQIKLVSGTGVRIANAFETSGKAPKLKIALA